MPQPLSSVEKGNSYFHYLPSVKTTAITVAVVTIVGLGAYLALSNPDFALSMPSLTTKNVVLGGLTFLCAWSFFETIFQYPNQNQRNQTPNYIYTDLTPLEVKIFENGYGFTDDELFECFSGLSQEEFKQVFAKMVPHQDPSQSPQPFISGHLAAKLFEVCKFNPTMHEDMIEGMGDDFGRIAYTIHSFNESKKLQKKSVECLISILRERGILIQVLEKMNWGRGLSFDLLSMDEIELALSNKFKNEDVGQEFCMLSRNSMEGALEYYLVKWKSDNQQNLTDLDSFLIACDRLFEKIASLTQSRTSLFKGEVLLALVHNLDKRLEDFYKKSPTEESKRLIESLITKLESYFKEGSEEFKQEIIKSISKTLNDTLLPLHSFFNRPMMFLYLLCTFENSRNHSTLLKRLGRELPKSYYHGSEKLKIILDIMIGRLGDKQRDEFLCGIVSEIPKIGTDKPENSEILFVFYQILNEELRVQYFGNITGQLSIFHEIVWRVPGNAKEVEPKPDGEPSASSSKSY